MSVGEKLDVLLLQEELNRGKPNWEHLSEELHVLIQCEDTPNRARVKLARAVEEVKKLLVPAVSFSSSFFSGGGGGVRVLRIVPLTFLREGPFPMSTIRKTMVTAIFCHGKRKSNGVGGECLCNIANKPDPRGR